MSELEQRVAALERRFDVLAHEQAIERLQYIFGYYLDHHLWDEVVALFSDDAPSIEMGQRGRYDGKGSIRRFLHELLGHGRSGLRRDEIDNWMQMQWVVTIDDDGHGASARGRSLRQSFDGVDRGTIAWEEGSNENRYVLEDGLWRISRLWYVPTLAVAMPTIGDTWHRSLPENKDFPPDIASIPIDEALGRSFQPFHFPHPITGLAVSRSPASAEKDPSL